MPSRHRMGGGVAGSEIPRPMRSGSKSSASCCKPPSRRIPSRRRLEEWLLARCLAAAGGPSIGAVRAMALEIFADWRLGQAIPAFQAWLDKGAPSEDGVRPAPSNLSTALRRRSSMGYQKKVTRPARRETPR